MATPGGGTLEIGLCEVRSVLVIRLGLWALFLIAAAITYPWAALVIGLVGAAWLIVSVRARTRRKPPTVVGGVSSGMSLDRRVALRQARAELYRIERDAGLS